MLQRAALRRLCTTAPTRTVRALSTRAPGASTVNADEVSLFNRLASQWWDESGDCWLLHRMNPPRVQFIRDKLAETMREEDENAVVPAGKILRGMDVLDVGCGGGLLSEASLSSTASSWICSNRCIEPCSTRSKYPWDRRCRSKHPHRHTPCRRGPPPPHKPPVPTHLCRISRRPGQAPIRRRMFARSPRARRQPCRLPPHLCSSRQGTLHSLPFQNPC